MSLTAHQVNDLLLYLPFLIGQLLYIMKRAGFSMRAGRAPSRRAYVYQNWDILTFRTALEIGIYYVVRHYSLVQIIGFFHLNLSGISWLSFLDSPVESPIALFFVGVGSDSSVDWAVDWASRDQNTKVPQWVKNWLKENIANGNSQGPKV